MLLPKEIVVTVTKDGNSVDTTWEKFIDIVVSRQRKLALDDVTVLLNNINKLTENRILDGEEIYMKGFTFEIK